MASTKNGKEPKNPVSVEKVDAFKAKCEVIPSINKLVMISKVGFQKGAILKAASYGIDLYTLNEVSESLINGWFDSYIIRPMQANRRLTKIALDFIDNPIDDFEPTDIVVVEDGVKQLTLLNLVQDVIDLTIAQPRLRVSDTESLPNEVRREAGIQLRDTYIIRNSKKCYIKSIFIEVTDTYTVQGGMVRGDVYQGPVGSNEIPVHSIIAEDGNIFSAIKKSDHEIDLFMRVSPNEDSAQSNSIIKLATIRTK